MKGLPEVRAQRGVAACVEFDLHVPGACQWFSGHFRGWPILPGVVHVGWAAHFSAVAFALATPPQSLKRIKFKHPIRPDADLTLRLTREGDMVVYDYFDAGVSMSSGVLCFGH